MPDMSLVADLEHVLLEAVAATCVTCWKETHPPPPESALYLMDDWKWEAGCQLRRQAAALELAWDEGCEGTANDLQLAAHREMYARSGDDADLARMLRHVT